MTFAEWVKSDGNSMESVAKTLGTTRQAVHGWATGRMCPRIYYACVIETLSKGQVPVSSWLTAMQQAAVEGFAARVASGSPGQE